MGKHREGVTPPSRAELAETLGRPIEFPDPGPMGYMLSLWSEAGKTSPVGMGGEMPLSWEAIDAYERATKQYFEPWEARLLQEMSAAFLVGRAEGEKTHSPGPDADTAPETGNGLDDVMERAASSVRVKQARDAKL